MHNGRSSYYYMDSMGSNPATCLLSHQLHCSLMASWGFPAINWQRKREDQALNLQDALHNMQASPSRQPPHYSPFLDILEGQWWRKSSQWAKTLVVACLVCALCCRKKWLEWPDYILIHRYGWKWFWHRWSRDLGEAWLEELVTQRNLGRHMWMDFCNWSAERIFVSHVSPHQHIWQPQQRRIFIINWTGKTHFMVYSGSFPSHPCHFLSAGAREQWPLFRRGYCCRERAELCHGLNLTDSHSWEADLATPLPSLVASSRSSTPASILHHFLGVIGPATWWRVDYWISSNMDEAAHEKKRPFLR